MDMAEKIKTLRLQNDMTLEELGNKVGVAKSTVRKWETGMISNMRRDKIAKIATALGVTPAYLMGWEENTDYLASIDDTEVIIDMEKPHKNVKTALDLYEKFSAADKKTQDAIKALLEME